MERSETFIRPALHNTPTDLIGGTGIKNPNLSPLSPDHGEGMDTSREGSYPTRSDGSDEFRGMWCDGYKIVNESQIIELLEFETLYYFLIFKDMIKSFLLPLISGDVVFPFKVSPNFVHISH